MFNVNLNLYKSFYYVAKYGGFTNASKKTFITQSSLSTNVKTLEDTLNIKLFKREKNIITLTKEGQDLFLKISDIVQIMTQEKDVLEINIGCIRSIADNYLSDVISTFNEINPKINFKILFADATDLFQALKKDDLDLIVCRYPTFYKFDRQVIVEKIINTKNIFACSSKKYEEFINTNKLSLLLPNASEKRRIVDQYLSDNDIEYDVKVELPNSILLKKLIVNGVGIGYINQDSIKEELENGILVEFEKLKNPPQDDVTIIYNSKNSDNVVKEFIKIIKLVIQKHDN